MCDVVTAECGSIIPTTKSLSLTLQSLRESPQSSRNLNKNFKTKIAGHYYGTEVHIISPAGPDDSITSSSL